MFFFKLLIACCRLCYTPEFCRMACVCGAICYSYCFDLFFFTLIGLAAAIKSRSINSFILLSQLYSLIFILPVLGYLNLFITSLCYPAGSRNVNASARRLSTSGHIRFLICGVYPTVLDRSCSLVGLFPNTKDREKTGRRWKICLGIERCSGKIPEMQ